MNSLLQKSHKGVYRRLGAIAEALFVSLLSSMILYDRMACFVFILLSETFNRTYHQ